MRNEGIPPGGMLRIRQIDFPSCHGSLRAGDGAGARCGYQPAELRAGRPEGPAGSSPGRDACGDLSGEGLACEPRVDEAGSGRLWASPFGAKAMTMRSGTASGPRGRAGLLRGSGDARPWDLSRSGRPRLRSCRAPPLRWPAPPRPPSPPPSDPTPGRRGPFFIRGKRSRATAKMRSSGKPGDPEPLRTLIQEERAIRPPQT